MKRPRTIDGNPPKVIHEHVKFGPLLRGTQLQSNSIKGDHLWSIVYTIHQDGKVDIRVPGVYVPHREESAAEDTCYERENCSRCSHTHQRLLAGAQ